MPASLGHADQDGIIAPATDPSHAGNWVVTFQQSDIGISLPEYECYRIVLKNGPPGSSFTIYIGNAFYDSVTPGDTNSWDPNNPMKLQAGDSIYFYWNIGTPNFAPMVTMYFQEPAKL